MLYFHSGPLSSLPSSVALVQCALSRPRPSAMWLCGATLAPLAVPPAPCLELPPSRPADTHTHARTHARTHIDACITLECYSLAGGAASADAAGASDLHEHHRRAGNPPRPPLSPRAAPIRTGWPRCGRRRGSRGEGWGLEGWGTWTGVMAGGGHEGEGWGTWTGVMAGRGARG